MPATPKPEKCLTGPSTSPPEPQLTLNGQLEDLTLVLPWVEALGRRYSVPADTQFAIELCLEEALSNIIRHGYRGQPNQVIMIECAHSRVENEGAGELVFTIEDHAPPFDPLAPSAAPAPARAANIEELLPGGQGIRLMRKFASSIAYRRLEIGNGDGNRLTIGFVLPH